MTAKERLEKIIELHGYKGVKVSNIDKIGSCKYCVQSYNKIPDVLLLYINKNYYITENLNNTYLEFNEYCENL